ncbi:WD repeat domain-containing protein [Tetrabaena socialis]|uniref:WD repeat domain-containing protein n=1 Tax=Tetrabaena socialis TaxID=47790 RepID=A0A2J8A3P5_9CHLO|nr:WD repeat domain-containing protein [Tetrabaena socialis]|eukprot:PNH07126.1 WD repeat domain-containing protein [Tetrabaena socialis]
MILASGGADHTLRFWTYQDADGQYEPKAKQLSVLKDHMAVSLDWSRDGSTIASCNGGRSFWLLDAHRALLGTSFEAHFRMVNWVMWNADGSRLISASSDGTIKIWDGTSGACTSTLRAFGKSDIRCVVSSPDGGMLVSCGKEELLTVWDAHTGMTLGYLSGHTGKCVHQVAWRTGFGGWTLASAGSDATVRLWVLADGPGFKRGKCTAVLTDHSQDAVCVAWNPTDGKVLASGGYDFVVRLWDVADDATSATCTAVLEGHGWIAFLAWSPDGKTLVSGGGTNDKLFMWAVDGGSAQCIRIIEDDAHVVNRGATLGISWHPSGREFVTTSFQSLRVYDAASAQLTAVLEGHSTMVMSACWRPDGNVIASSSYGSRDMLLYERAVRRPR